MWHHHLSRIFHTALSGPDRLLPLARLQARPLRIEIDINNYCNLRCPQCLRNSPRVPVNQAELTRADLERMAPWFESAQMVRLGGTGEPFLHREIADLIDLIHGRNAAVCVITNCTRLDEAMARRLCTRRPLLLNLSIDAGTPEIFEAVRLGAKYAEVVANIDRLVAIKRATGSVFPILNINMTLMRETLGELPQVIALARRWEAPVINAQTVIFFDPEANRDSAISEEEAGEAVAKTMPRAREAGIDLRFFPLSNSAHPSRHRPPAVPGRHYYCRMIWHHLWVDVAGNVNPCCMADFGAVGNIRDTPLADLWNHPKMVALRRRQMQGDPPAECRPCSMLDVRDLRELFRAWRAEWPNLKNML